MSTSEFAIELVRNMRDLGDFSTLTDALLLDRFLIDQDASAFEAIVRRHGPRVYSVCKHVLQCPHDAEDALQATFLLLVHKAAEIRDPDRIGSWLIGVAHRISTRSRIQSRRRSAYEKQKPLLDTGQTDHEIDQKELREILHQEIDRLEEPYRRLVLLCYIEGWTNDDVAKLLDCPTSTLKTRLARAREILRGRLSRRGITISAGFLMLFLDNSASAAEITTSVIDSVVNRVSRRIRRLSGGEARGNRTVSDPDDHFQERRRLLQDSHELESVNRYRKRKKTMHLLLFFSTILALLFVWFFMSWRFRSNVAAHRETIHLDFLPAMNAGEPVASDCPSCSYSQLNFRTERQIK